MLLCCARHVLVESLRTPAAALNAAREILAQQLAVDPDMCKKVRTHFEGHAALRLTATAKGKSEIDASHAFRRVIQEHSIA